MPLGYVTQRNHLIFTRHNLSHYFIILALKIHDLLLERKKILKCCTWPLPNYVHHHLSNQSNNQIQEIGANLRTESMKTYPTFKNCKQQQNGTRNIRGHRSMILMTTEIQTSFQDQEKQSTVISFMCDIKTKQ